MKCEKESVTQDNGRSGISRRNLLKLGTLGGAATALTALSKTRKAVAETAENEVRKQTSMVHGSIDQMVDISPDLKRFDQANSAFMKSLLGDFGVIPLNSNDDPKMAYAFSNIIFGWTGRNPLSGLGNPHLAKQEPGHTDLDYAFSRGGFAVEDYSGSFMARVCSGDSGPALKMPDGSLMPLTLYKQQVPFPGIFDRFSKKTGFDSAKDAAFAVKKAARLFGADLVGIAPYDERFVYRSEVYLPLDPQTGGPHKDHVDPFRKVEFGFIPKSVIVMAFEMDYEAYKCQPSAIGETATSMGYSRMMETSLRMAYMLRRLGYHARHAGNDTGVSVPLAIQAGLGESSRMGLLITEEFGPRVRIAKVYTDLEIQQDQPKSFGVKAFCEVCMKCADACPSKAISKAVRTTDPDNKPYNGCNQTGIDKWYNNHQKCLSFWGESWSECAVCISVCPYNKIKMWHHDVAKLVTRIPGLNSVARYLDEVFGYGKAYDPKLMKDYWKRTV